MWWNLYVMNIMNPEIKSVVGVITSVKEVKNDELTSYIVRSIDLLGNEYQFNVGNKVIAKVEMNKLQRIIYRECIAGVTQYIDEDDEVQLHETDHKDALDCTNIGAIELLIECKKKNILDLYEELKNLI